ncbi:hypothetical protein PoB_000960400 [Plakobranchus ocellatus]|uniref:Uncharacterized protein n=1 Tax=Plakobranchus ocellatus TaxID=259542 RepID=A0AAV3YJB0_9GAST|nr:hypothetical protein PoB_000960400 [Plakobranchus ocellatus]
MSGGTRSPMSVPDEVADDDDYHDYSFAEEKTLERPCRAETTSHKHLAKRSKIIWTPDLSGLRIQQPTAVKPADVWLSHRSPGDSDDVLAFTQGHCS